MFNTLRVQFGGIVCFAFVEEKGAVKQALALMADARRPRGHHGSHHPPHVAALQFYGDQLAEGSEVQPHLRFRRPGSNREEAVVFLARQDVEIEGTEKAPPPLLAEGRTSDGAPQTAVEERDFFWVADSERLGVRGLLPGCIGGTAAPDALVARFALRGGVLSTGGVQRSHGTALKAVFLDLDVNPPVTHPDYNQALAVWSDWDVPVSPRGVTLRLTDFDTKEQRRLTLSTAGLPFGSSLWMAVKNVTMPDLLEVSDVIEPESVHGAKGSHFDLHYRLADAPPSPTWIPDPNTVTDGEPLCPPTKIKVRP